MFPDAEFTFPLPPAMILSPERGEETMLEWIEKLMFELVTSLRYKSVTLFALVLALEVAVSAFLLKYDKRRRTAWAVMFGLGLGVLILSCIILSDSVLRWSGFIGWPPSPRRWLQRLLGLYTLRGLA
jgi:hypothetical protein